jgi:glutamyl-tRNA reductase
MSIDQFIRALYPNLPEVEASNLSLNVEEYNGDSAVAHALSVASSIESMIVGEREIITQVRNAFELSNANGITGDFLRLLIR